MASKELKRKVGEGRRRVTVEGVSPEIDGGRYSIKRVVGEPLVVEADIFADGHDVLSALLKSRSADDPDWTEIPMAPLVNDRWRAETAFPSAGLYFYTLEAWVDHFKSWRRDLGKKTQAGLDVLSELQAGALLVEATAERASREDAAALMKWAKDFGEGSKETMNYRGQLAMEENMARLMAQYPDRRLAAVYSKQLRCVVDPLRARCSAWYEFFPRSFGSEPGRHGTFKDCIGQLKRVSEMGFDVLYLPPIHPIGRAFRKGKNNNPQAAPHEPGSPWGIGAKEGGHKAVHPDLGSMADFEELVKQAERMNIKIALDIAFQCSPDHPYVKEHPEWFKKRPDGTIQYAENPPKKYQDIYPIDFETEQWEELWHELKSVFEFWIKEGVTIFRVDNPHTKAFSFWEWAITELKKDAPEVIFLAEAFTRPKPMYNLAKLGFTQSYNYFPWRNTKLELTEFLTELTRTQVKEFFRPNLWPNTPDILPQYLQFGGRPAFITRFVLASTLGASYGIYGPAFELCDHQPRVPGAEEYLNSEKYEIKNWDLNAPGNLTELITKVNQIRQENPALQWNDTIEFHETDNDQLICYSKRTREFDNIMLMVVNLDPHHAQTGWTRINLDALKIEPSDTYQVHDLLTGARHLWSGARNYVELNPQYLPAHIFRLRRRVRSEQDFDYFM